MSHLRVALTTTDDVYDTGGVENSIMRIARGLAASGVEVDVVMLRLFERTVFQTGGSNGVTRLPSSVDGLRLYRITPWVGSEQAEQRWAEMHYSLLALARERGYDLLQAFYASVAGFPTVYAAELLGIPSVVSIRGNDLIADVFHPQWFAQLVWALQHTTQLTAVSREGLERARVLCSSPAKGRVILNSVRPQDFLDGVQELALSRPVIGSLAVFRAKKGMEVLLSAFRLLLERIPSAHLLLVGYVVPTEQRHFDELVAKYGLEGKFTLTGGIPHNESLRYLRAMDVFAFTSLHDGCPNAVLEAMLAGLPIVAASSGALPDMIEHGREGLLVQPGSAMELCEAIERIVGDGEMGKAFGERARERVLRQFTLQRELREYVEVYRACGG
ncbi:MAG TPA: glycosyltransferase family 4 protein [Ktedonobacteraceae bacterium]|nr:glycosyltransferase family 4 protein [Ktedonobacteraceae bacterium]